MIVSFIEGDEVTLGGGRGCGLGLNFQGSYNGIEGFAGCRAETALEGEFWLAGWLRRVDDVLA